MSEIEPEPIAAPAPWHATLGAYLEPMYGLRDWKDAVWLLDWLQAPERRVEFSAWLDAERWGNELPEDPREP